VDEVDGADLMELGVAPEEVAKLQALYGKGSGTDTGDVLVTPDNWPAVEVFLVQENRWRRKPNGALEGLDMTQVESTMRLIGIRSKDRRSVFWKLRTMEMAALEETAR
jgi:hypothetical protein